MLNILTFLFIFLSCNAADDTAWHIVPFPDTITIGPEGWDAYVHDLNYCWGGDGFQRWKEGRSPWLKLDGTPEDENYPGPYVEWRTYRLNYEQPGNADDLWVYYGQQDWALKSESGFATRYLASCIHLVEDQEANTIGKMEHPSLRTAGGNDTVWYFAMDSWNTLVDGLSTLEDLNYIFIPAIPSMRRNEIQNDATISNVCVNDQGPCLSDITCRIKDVLDSDVSGQPITYKHTMALSCNADCPDPLKYIQGEASCGVKHCAHVVGESPIRGKINADGSITHLTKVKIRCQKTGRRRRRAEETTDDPLDSGMTPQYDLFYLDCLSGRFMQAGQYNKYLGCLEDTLWGDTVWTKDDL